MKKIKLNDEKGNPLEYEYEVTKGSYNQHNVDEFKIKALGSEGQPYIIQLIEEEYEVRVMYQDRNGNALLEKKNIFGSMLPLLYKHYKKDIISSSLRFPRYPDETRVPETAGKMYKKLYVAGVIFFNPSRDVYYYRDLEANNVQ